MTVVSEEMHYCAKAFVLSGLDKEEDPHTRNRTCMRLCTFDSQPKRRTSKAGRAPIIAFLEVIRYHESVQIGVSLLIQLQPF